ncbi:MAG: hypothetical protein P1U56_12220 [Saprospiraceae bacterium]|nr:hypothetical protein [Saprospiraceae bacterium]
MRIFLMLIALSCFGSSSFAQSDWELQKDKNGIKVWTKDYPNSKYKQFKAKTKIKAELQNVVAVFLDIENMGDWYDRVEKVDLVEKISEMEGVYKIDFELPWPVEDRISAVRSVLSHDPITNVVTVTTKYEKGVIKDDDRLVVTDMHSVWVLTPEEGGYVDIYHKGYMHPAGSLPAWISNSGVKSGPVKTLTALQRILPQYAEIKVGFLK